MSNDLQYWIDLSDCVCGSPNAIGACLKCDLERVQAEMKILDLLCSMDAKLDKLLERKKRGSVTQRAKNHDKAVEAPLGIDMSKEWHEAWMHWCARRREAKIYMTELAIKGALNKLGRYDEATQIAALQAASVKPWADVYPESVEIKTDMKGQDWFNGND